MFTIRFDELRGVVDGINQIFFANSYYAPNTTALFVNGILQSDPSEWSETNPEIGEIFVNPPPLPGDKLKLFYVISTLPYLKVLADIDIDGRCSFSIVNVATSATMATYLIDKQSYNTEVCSDISGMTLVGSRVLG